MLISLTVGKVDAGIAILLTEDRRLIEFPSILLPSGISSGSIVDIQVSRNAQAELAAQTSFTRLQDEIYNTFGIRTPSKPQLRIRNATQTSVVLEWDPIDLATATLRSLTLYRNNAKAGSIPNPTTHTSTKISGLAVDTEYAFHLVLKTSAGVYSSDKLTVRTHKMTDLSGITVCPGIMPPEARENLEATLARIGAKPLQDFVRIDTTHFVCTEGRGQGWERATEMNIPVVRPEWVDACENQGRIVGVRAYYLNADPRLRPALREKPKPQQQQQPSSPPPPQPQQQQQQQQQQPQPQPQPQPQLSPTTPKENSPIGDSDAPKRQASPSVNVQLAGRQSTSEPQVENDEKEEKELPPFPVEQTVDVEKEDESTRIGEEKPSELPNSRDVTEHTTGPSESGGGPNLTSIVEDLGSEEKSEEGFENVAL